MIRGFALALLICVPTVASAQPTPTPTTGYYEPGPGPAVPPKPPGNRLTLPGWNLGAELGLGVLTCANCDDSLGAGSASVRLGFMISKGLTLQGEIFVTSAPVNEFVSYNHVILDAGIRYWLSPRLWIQGGLGSGVVTVDYDGFVEAQTEPTFALTGGIGYEFATSKYRSIDVHFKAGASVFNGAGNGDDFEVQSFIFGVGFNWFWFQG